MANQAKISAGSNEFNRRRSCGRGRQNSSHFQIVRHNQVAISHALAQDFGNPPLRERRRSPVFRDQRISRVRNHRHRQLRSQRAVRQQIFGPKLLERLLNHRQVVTAVERALAKAGKVLAASQNARGSKPGEKLARISNRLTRIRRNRARTHHVARSFKRQIEHGSEVDVESKSTAILSDHLPVLAEKLAIAGREHVRRRRSGTKHIAKTVHLSTFEIDTSKQRSRNALLAIPQQTPGLRGTLYISREQDYTGRLQPREQGSEPRRHFRAVKADDQKLTDRHQCRSSFHRSPRSPGDEGARRTTVLNQRAMATRKVTREICSAIESAKASVGRVVG